MKVIAYRNVTERTQLPEASIVVMDEPSYRQLGIFPAAANVIISSNPQRKEPGCFVRSYVGDAIRIAIGAGFEKVLIIGATLYEAARAYSAELR